jgi:hypothetical protein
MRTIKRIHVDQHVIRANKKKPLWSQEPPLTVQNRGRSYKAWEVAIDGPSKVIYNGEKPLSCGAHCWVETKAPVHLDGKSTIL